MILLLEIFEGGYKSESWDFSWSLVFILCVFCWALLDWMTDLVSSVNSTYTFHYLHICNKVVCAWAGVDISQIKEGRYNIFFNFKFQRQNEPSLNFMATYYYITRYSSKTHTIYSRICFFNLRIFIETFNKHIKQMCDNIPNQINYNR